MASLLSKILERWNSALSTAETGHIDSVWLESWILFSASLLIEAFLLADVDGAAQSAVS